MLPRGSILQNYNIYHCYYGCDTLLIFLSGPCWAATTDLLSDKLTTIVVHHLPLMWRLLLGSNLEVSKSIISSFTLTSTSIIALVMFEYFLLLCCCGQSESPSRPTIPHMCHHKQCLIRMRFCIVLVCMHMCVFYVQGDKWVSPPLSLSLTVKCLLD